MILCYNSSHFNGSFDIKHNIVPPGYINFCVLHTEDPDLYLQYPLPPAFGLAKTEHAKKNKHGKGDCGGHHSFYKNQSCDFCTGTPGHTATNNPISQSFIACTIDHLNEFDDIFKNLDITSTGGDSQLHSPMESVADPSTVTSSPTNNVTTT
ncbi:hypothetical protein V8B97DRAFT_2023184 [Scleroderma yunnanense]